MLSRPEEKPWAGRGFLGEAECARAQRTTTLEVTELMKVQHLAEDAMESASLHVDTGWNLGLHNFPSIGIVPAFRADSIAFLLCVDNVHEHFPADWSDFSMIHRERHQKNKP